MSKVRSLVPQRIRRETGELVLLAWATLLLIYAWVELTIRAVWKRIRGGKTE